MKKIAEKKINKLTLACNPCANGSSALANHIALFGKAML